MWKLYIINCHHQRHCSRSALFIGVCMLRFFKHDVNSSTLHSVQIAVYEICNNVEALVCVGYKNMKQLISS